MRRFPSLFPPTSVAWGYIHTWKGVPELFFSCCFFLPLDGKTPPPSPTRSDSSRRRRRRRRPLRLLGILPVGYMGHPRILFSFIGLLRKARGTRWRCLVDNFPALDSLGGQQDCFLLDLSYVLLYLPTYMYDAHAYEASRASRCSLRAHLTHLGKRGEPVCTMSQDIRCTYSYIHMRTGIHVRTYIHVLTGERGARGH